MKADTYSVEYTIGLTSYPGVAPLAQNAFTVQIIDLCTAAAGLTLTP